MPDAPPSPAEVARGEGWIARALDGVSADEVPRQVLTRRDGRRVCLNVVAPRVGGQGWSRYSAAAARRAALSGDRLLPLAATGQSEGTFFVAYLIGDTIPLSAYRDAAELTTSQCLQLLWGIGRALDEAAAAGFHPTEVSPESVFVDHARGAYLADLGVAREGVGNPPAERDVHAPWVAPEILAGGSAVERSGVYSFGALMYTMLTGVAPYRGSREGMAGPASLREVRPDLPEALELVVATAMSREPDRRYRSASEARSLAHIVLQSELHPTVSAPPRQNRFRRGHTGGVGEPTKPPTGPEHEAAREQRERDRHAKRGRDAARAAERERNRFDKQQRRARARAKRRAERERNRLANEQRKRRLEERRERQWAAEQEHQKKRAAQREEQERERAAEREREAVAKEQREAAERAAAAKRNEELAAQRERERAAAEKRETELAAQRERERAAAEKRDKELAAQRERERAAAEKRDKELAAQRAGRERAAAEKRERELAAQRKREQAAAEKRERQAAAQRERERVAAEERDKQVAAQRQRERAAAEKRDKQVAARRERERIAKEEREQELAARRERERAAKEEREVALAAQRAHERAVREAREGELAAQRERAAKEKRDAEARTKRTAERRVERERKARLRTARLERGRERRDATVRALRERTEGLGAQLRRAQVATRQRVEQAAQARTRRERRERPAAGGRTRPLPEWRSSLSRSVPLALVCSAVALGALGGVLIGGPGDAKPPQPQRLSAAGVGLTLPVGWEGNASAGGAIEAHPADDPGSGLRLERVNAPVEREEQANPVRLGRLEAWREPRADIPGARSAVRYVVPTAAGKLVATCRASARAAPDTLAQCEGAASTLRLRSATGLPLAAVIEQQERWQAEVIRLASERADARRKLAAASLPAGQRLAAEALARVHERAAVRFGALPGGKAVAGAARRTAAAYTALAASAGGDSSGLWNAARERLRRAETALSRALASA